MSKNSDKVFEMLDVIVERIEEESVVQVITNNTTDYKVTGKLLMRKRKRLFCISCVVH
jgi:hypothetical protein